jgi:hypothetical protein
MEFKVVKSKLAANSNLLPAQICPPSLTIWATIVLVLMPLDCGFAITAAVPPSKSIKSEVLIVASKSIGNDWEFPIETLKSKINKETISVMFLFSNIFFFNLIINNLFFYFDE